MSKPLTVRELKELLDQYDLDLLVLYNGVGWPTGVCGGGILPVFRPEHLEEGAFRIKHHWDDSTPFDVLMLGASHWAWMKPGEGDQ